MLRLLFLTHRWLGIGLGIVMVLWCLSGFVMMYKPYPELSDEEFLDLLPPLTLKECCQVPSTGRLEEWQYREFHIQMLGPFPVLHLRTTDGRLVSIDLSHDRVFHAIPQDFALNLSAGFARSHGYPESNLLGVIDNDQWTVYGAYNPHRPLYHMAAGDEAGTEWYLSSRTGEVVQLTTREQRVWGYLGAVIHWLYPTLLREKVRLWSEVVIWLTVFSILLTASGLYFGIRQFRRRNNGRVSPYRGLSLWHHYAGLVFGLFTFTWVLSGLFSMQPYGFLEGEGYQAEAERLRGGTLDWADLRSVLSRLSSLALPAETVRLEGRLLQGQLALYSVGGDGGTQRFNAQSGRPEDLTDDIRLSLARLLSPSGSFQSAELISAEDAYYYHHHDAVKLPAYRVITPSPERTRYYLDPDSGDILNKIDRPDKWYRWLHYGLHRGDFTRFLRARPVWDLFMGLLMLGVTLGSLTGLCLGYRRLAR